MKSPASKKSRNAPKRQNVSSKTKPRPRRARKTKPAPFKVKHRWIGNGAASKSFSHPSTRLNEEAIFDIRRRYDAKEPIKQIAADYDLYPSYVVGIGKRRHWARLPEESEVKKKLAATKPAGVRCVMESTEQLIDRLIAERISPQQRIRRPDDRRLKNAKPNIGAKLSKAKVYRIREAYDRGDTITEIAKKFGICRSNVFRIGKRIQWKELPEKTK